MADKAIGELTQASSIRDDDLFVLEQGGDAKKLNGKTLLEYVTLDVTKVEAETLPAGSEATGDYDKATGTLKLGIPTGPAGSQGEKGDKGDRGEQGEQGVQGPQGEQGEKGDTGETGPKGEKGDTGDTGAQGPKGDKGDTGATGATGPEGPAGPQGAKGDKGDTGERGPQGERGEKGETGKGFKILGYYSTPSALDEAKKATAEPGDAYGVGAGEPYDVYIFDGVTGEFVNNGPLQGAQGEPGATGATGPQGPAGPAGNDGAAGKDGTTYTPSVDAEGNLSWTNDGGKANPESVNIRGPQGLKGDTGDTGATGATGPAGPTGATGAQGPAGKDGAAGAAGATFTPSVDADGNLSWTNDGGRENPATMNIRGPQGAAGPAGADGAAGAQGPAGAAGAAATINGVNALTLTAQEPLSLEQSGSTATLKMTGSPGIEAASYTATLSSSGWAASGSYQAQTVNVSGLKASYPVSPVIDAQLTGTDADGDAAVLEAWSAVNYVTSESGKITAYCIGDAPTANIPLIINTWG